MENNTQKMSFNVIKPKDKYVPSFSEIARVGYDSVYYGNDNKFPQYLWGLYIKSPILASIINGTSDFIFGNGIEWNENLPITTEYINDDGDNLDDLVKKLIVDYQIFGGFALKVCRNSMGEISDIYWMDFQNVRINEESTIAYYFPKGLKNQNKKEEYPIFDEINQFMTSVYYFKGHLSRGYYPIPRYVGALQAIETSIEISKFHLNTIHNNFSGNFIINYNNADFTEEQKNEIQKGVADNFTGAENAGKFMLAFNTSKDNAVTVARIPEDSFDAKYQALKESTMKDIFVAFRAPQQLFGYTTEGTAFNTQEFQEAFKLYNKTCVKPIQADIKRVLCKIFNLDNCMNFITFNLEEGDK